MGESGYCIYLKAMANIVVTVLGIALPVFIVYKAWPILAVLAIGWGISRIAYPVACFLGRTAKIKEPARSAAAIFLVVTAIAAFFLVAAAGLLKETAKFASRLPVLLTNGEALWQGLSSRLSLLVENLSPVFRQASDKILENAEGLVASAISFMKAPAIKAVGSFATSVPTVLVDTVLCILFAYYCISGNRKPFEYICKALPDAIKEKTLILKKIFMGAIWRYCKAQVKIETRIFGILLLGFTVLGIESPFLFALIVSVTDILPILGTGTVLLPWSAAELLLQDYPRAVGLLAVWVVTLAIRQLIQPKIVSESIGLPPIPTIVLTLAGYHAAGVAGLVLAAPIGIVAVDLYREGVFDTSIHSLKTVYRGFEGLFTRQQ